jgi:UDP-glucose 4-epimerase
MAKHDCDNFVFSSSATVYGTPDVIPIPEVSPLQPESSYGRTKAMVEHLLMDICRSGTHERNAPLKAVSVRYFK